MERPKTSIFMMFGFLRPLRTFIYGFEHTKLFSKTQYSIQKQTLKYVIFEILEFGNLDNSKFQNLGILEIVTSKTLKMWFFEYLIPIRHRAGRHQWSVSNALPVLGSLDLFF